MVFKIEDIITDPELKTRYWLVRKCVCLVAYYGGLRTNEVRSIEFGKTFSGGVSSFEHDSNGYWFSFERSKQRGATETTTICVPRRQSDWSPVCSDSFRSPVDYDPASIIDEYLAVLESDYKLSREELTGPFFRSTHGVDGLKFVQLPLGVNMLAKVGIEFASQHLLPNPLGFTSHCWRRSCGTNASNAGVNVTTLMAQLGWSTPKTALGYVKKSKVTSLTMSMFLSNIQRQNKVLSPSGVRSTPEGVQLLKSDNDPRSAKKKLNSNLVSPLVGLGHESDLASGPSESDLEISEFEKSDEVVRECKIAFGELVGNESLVECSSSSSSVGSSSISVVRQTGHRTTRQTAPQTAPPQIAPPQPAPLQTAPIQTAPPQTAPQPASLLPLVDCPSAPSSEVSFSVPTSIEFIDPRAAAILQNFQNNGNVQIHFHFNDRK